MRARGRLLAVILVTAAFVSTACGSSRHGAQPVTVFAAASLTEAFTQVKSAVAKERNPLAVTYSFAGSQQLVAQITSGAPADVVATADTASMDKLVRSHLVEQPVPFATNVLEIAVRPGNPKHISGLADLGRRDLAVVLADASVPAGRYAQQALAKAGTTVQPKSLELDVKSALRKVAAGEADAAVVYASDVAAAGSSVTGIAIPAGQNVTATYPIAVVSSSKHQDAARRFVDEVLHGAGPNALRAAGFSTT